MAEPEPVGERGGALLEIENAVKTYRLRSGGLGRRPAQVRAVDGVSLAVRAHETVGVVGESGCGKSTLAKLALGLESPDSGSVTIAGRPLETTTRQWRSGVIQMIMQDPYASLNPRMTVFDIVGEAFLRHRDRPKGSRRRELVLDLLRQVGLSERQLGAFPRQLSGGQRQRVGVARALAPNPSVIVCDEPVSALDVSVQAQVVNLLRSLQDELGLAYVFISHDLAVVRHVADRIAVMYLGRIVEEGPAETVYERPAHPYTRLLLDSVPGAGHDRPAGAPPPGDDAKEPAAAEPVAVDSATVGCPFRSRCWKATERCATETPEPRPVGDVARLVRCHHPDQVPVASAH